MREATLKLYNRVQSITVTNNNIETRRIVLRAMLAALALLALSYALILGTLIWNIVERKNLEKEAQALSADVGALELTYLSLTQEIDGELSRTMGFVETPPNFATRKSLGSLANASNEI